MAKKSRRLKPLRNTKTCSLLSMLTLTSSFFLVEIIVGYITGSVALIADSFHMLSDVISLIVGFFALRYSKKAGQTDRNTFGWQRAEVLGALINAVFLVALCFTILIEAMKRLVEVEAINNPWLVLIIGGLGLLVNVIGLFMFHGHGHGHSHGGGSNGHSHGKSMPAIKPGDTISNKGNDSSVKLDEQTNETVFGSTSYLKDAKEIQKFATGKHAHDNASSWALSKELSTCLIAIVTLLVMLYKVFLRLQGLYMIVREKSVDLPQCSSSDSENHALHNERKVTTSAQMNMRAVYLHVVGDALGSVIVIASSLCIIYGEGDWTLYVDPGMSLVMVLIIMKSSVPLLKESALILMQTVPTHIKIQEVRERLLQQVDGVLSLHEFHVWQLAGDKIIASAHITCRSMADYMPIANKVKDFFHNEGIHSTTIQPEFIEDPPELTELGNCVLDCGGDKDCGAQRCCPEDVRQRNKSPVNQNEENGLPGPEEIGMTSKHKSYTSIVDTSPTSV